MATHTAKVIPRAEDRPTHVRYWVVVFAVTLAVFSYIDRVALSRAAGTISKDLGLNKEQMGWVFFAFACAYVDERGRPLHRTIRTPAKAFPQEHIEGGVWITGRGPRLVLYHLDELVKRKSEMVCIAEGEKDVDRLRSIGYLATCNPLGAGKWRQSYTDTVANRNIVLFYDNDAPVKQRVGQEHAANVALALHKAGCTIRIVDLPRGKDVSDFLDAGGTKQMLDELIRTAPHLDLEGIHKWRMKFDASYEEPTSTEWPDPILLLDDRVETLRVDILPGALGDYAEALSRFTETPAELSVLAVLGVLSTAAAGKAEVEPEPGYVEPVNLYVCPVLEKW